MNTKLAILASRFPLPLTKGDSLRLFKQIEVLADHFSIHLYCINEHYPSQEELDQAHQYCSQIKIYILAPKSRKVNIATHYFSDIPMQVRYFYDQKIHQSIQTDIKDLNPHFILAQLIRMVPYTNCLPSKIAMGIDLMDSMVLNDLAGQYFGQKFLLFLRARERRLIRRYEKNVIEKFNEYFTISDRDKNMLPEELAANCTLVSNGVDIGYYDNSLARRGEQQEFDLVFCGNMGYRPNIMASTYLRKKIIPLVPDLKCLIAGTQGDSLDVPKKGELLTIRGFQEDIREVYLSARMMVVPIFTGSGQQNKILEAMALSVPCITTSFVNQAIGAREGSEILIADTPRQFMEHIKSLISQPDLGSSLGRMGRTFVEKNFNWKRNTEILVRKIKESVENESVSA